MKPVYALLTFFLLTCCPELAAQSNFKPRITGQTQLTINEDQSITILMTYLSVQDPDDWFYPWGFTMKIYPGDNYTFQGQVVMPAPNFYGTLSVKVTVNDGQSESDVYNLQITVNPVNDKPVITGHTSLVVNEGQPFTILREHLRVSDPDDKYPDDFTLRVHNGGQYTTNGNQITPVPNFTGNLLVNVSVNDGAIDSDIYALPITVRPINRVPQIRGQAELQINEDESITIELSHLLVTDDDSKYPDGFSLSVGEGENYAYSGTKVTPATNFFGQLVVPVTVSDGTHTSPSFNLAITVNPVEDVPVIDSVEPTALNYNVVDQPIPISNTVQVHEFDGDSIISAEIRLRPETYQRDIDKLVFNAEPGSKVSGTFDTNQGILVLSGQASPERYTSAIRSVTYQCLLPSRDMTKAAVITVSDGKSTSEMVERRIVFGRVTVALDVPSAFTPNGDMANDTWKIIPLSEEEQYAGALIRVYNKEGILVYEGVGFEQEWDGRYRGELLPAGTYYYTIDLNLGAPEGFLRGLVTILR